MKIIDCNIDHLEQIREIMNDAILHSTSSYYSEPRSLAEMKAWLELKIQNNFPVIGIVDEQDKLLGFATYGPFRNWPGYRFSIEHTLYVHKNHRGNGLGKILLAEIIKKAKQQSYHCLIGGIDSTNKVSIQLHLSMGFEYCGKIKEVGHKFSKWLDLEFYQLILEKEKH